MILPIFMLILYWKIGGRDFEALGKILDALNALAEENNTTLVFTVSADASELPESVKKYL